MERRHIARVKLEITVGKISITTRCIQNSTEGLWPDQYKGLLRQDNLASIVIESFNISPNIVRLHHHVIQLFGKLAGLMQE
jgi:hypothetical protein